LLLAGAVCGFISMFAPYFCCAGNLTMKFFLDALIDRMYDYKKEKHQFTPEKYDLSFDEVDIPATDGARLYGWWIPASPHAPTLILLHGWGRNLSRTMPYIQALHLLGYNLLAFDARNHGSSSPVEHPTVGTFSQDALSAVKFLRSNQPGTNEIGMVGLSVGGGASINAAGWDERIRAVVTVGAISHPVAVMKYEFRKRRIPAFAASFLLAYMRWRYRLDFDAIAPLNNIPKSNADFLLIHGGHDETVPLEQAQALSAAGKPAKTRLWIVPEKGHSDCNTHPLFWENVGAFLQETLPLS
ncbi:MAG: alpha/beta fold hydrolase, partial [Gallionella sp.]|nr:alpha/beta fold hydrolase [Gallionella sp.]